MKFIPEAEDGQILRDVAQRNPTYLIGGYSIDPIILAIWKEYHTELQYQGRKPDLEEIHSRITKCLDIIYEGIV